MESINKQITDLITKKGLVITIGLGTTGKSVTEHFSSNGVEVVVIEKLSREQFVANASNLKFLQNYEQKSSTNGNKVTFCFEDKFSESAQKKITQTIEQKIPIIAVISPGISKNSPMASKVRSLNIRIIGELELALSLVNVPVVMVTGSNGKSTTVSIIDQILKASNINSFLCGNIGQPVLEVLKAKKLPDILVVEASSYQLESANSIRPKVAVYLNLSSNHLERHGTLENYHAAKMKMFANQTKQDIAVLNCDDEKVFSASSAIESTASVFGYYPPKVGNTCNYSLVNFNPQSNVDTIEVRFNGSLKSFDCSKSLLIGVHTRLNMAAAIMAALTVGASDEGIKTVIANFGGLVHRLQKVTTKSGLFAINDSKSTTVASTVAAYDSIRKNFPSSPICLLVGGKMKIGSWQPIANAIHSNQSTYMTRVICFGGDGAIILQELENHGIIASLARNVSEAVSLACDWIRENEIVLFSPGCASFDEFSNFEQRGEIFIKLIKER
jgi:UDP-N-acetylmuramoylalanine--D-glutamate ligase